LLVPGGDEVQKRGPTTVERTYQVAVVTGLGARAVDRVDVATYFSSATVISTTTPLVRHVVRFGASIDGLT